MGVAQKTMFSISDRLTKCFGIFGAPMEHNAIAKSKQTFFYKLGHFGISGPGLSIIPKTKKFDCGGRGDLTFLCKSCEIYESQGGLI